MRNKRMARALQNQGNPYLPSEYTVLDFRRESEDTFTLTLSAKLKHEPGQFVQVYLPGIGECPISISSYTGENLELTVREIGNVTRALSRLKKGDSVYVRGPYGKGYPMKELKGNSLVMVGGGCGVAPLKGIVEYVERNRGDYDEVRLFFGFRSPTNILFQQDLVRWGQTYHLNVTVDQNPPAACYEGNVGYVTQMLEDAPFNNDKKVAFLCGPPRMMQSSIAILQKKGFHDDQLFLSAERLMYCAIGKCCHCMIRGKFTCLDGPVFRYDEIKDYVSD